MLAWIVGRCSRRNIRHPAMLSLIGNLVFTNARHRNEGVNAYRESLARKPSIPCPQPQPEANDADEKRGQQNQHAHVEQPRAAHMTP